MNLFPSALQRRREPPSAALIRIFQSETAEIREDPEPFQLRLTLHALAGLVIALVAVSLLMQLNRVVASSAGQIVTSDPTIVLQALDASIIKSLDVQEGERVKGGQLLATLDPTFAAADVSAATLQIAKSRSTGRTRRGGARASGLQRASERASRQRVHGAAESLLRAAQRPV